MKFIKSGGIIVTVGVGHGAGAAIDGDQSSILVQAEVVVVEEEEVMSEFMSQGAGPIFAQGAGRIAEAVPDGTDTHLTGFVGDHLCRG